MAHMQRWLNEGPFDEQAFSGAACGDKPINVGTNWVAIPKFGLVHGYDLKSRKKLRTSGLSDLPIDQMSNTRDQVLCGLGSRLGDAAHHASFCVNWQVPSFMRQQYPVLYISHPRCLTNDVPNIEILAFPFLFLLRHLFQQNYLF